MSKVPTTREMTVHMSLFTLVVSSDPKISGGIFNNLVPFFLA